MVKKIPLNVRPKHKKFRINYFKIIISFLIFLIIIGSSVYGYFYYNNVYKPHKDLVRDTLNCCNGVGYNFNDNDVLYKLDNECLRSIISDSEDLEEGLITFDQFTLMLNKLVYNID